jgi:DNA-binding CsgD family transcriptional regulator/EAL domain-containing protein (putative c-di-GMP-specific phosphodiesterase class I)
MSIMMDVLTTKNNDSIYKKIIEFRIQPLVSLQTNEIVAWEILSRLSPELIDIEKFFNEITPAQSLAIFFSQFHAAKSRSLKTGPAQYWLNLPVAVIADEFSIEQLNTLAHDGGFVIEVQDPENIKNLDVLSRFNFIKGLRRLKKTGWPVYLDDVTPDLTADIDSIGLKFKGIKTCRTAMPDTKAELKAFIGWVSSLRSHGSVIVAEGIETEDMRELAVLSGADLGQGFLWPEKSLALSTTGIQRYAERLEEARNRRKVNGIRISIPDRNEVWVQGILLLLTEILHSEGMLQDIVLTNEANSDLIFRESWCGLPPINCDRYRHDPVYRQKATQRRMILVYPNKNQLDNRLHCPAISAYITLEDTVQELYASLRRLVIGGKNGRANRNIMDGSTGCSIICKNQKLNDKELYVITKVSEGMKYSDIAKILQIGPKMVSSYKRSAMCKLGLQNNVDLLSYFNWRAM